MIDSRKDYVLAKLAARQLRRELSRQPKSEQSKLREELARLAADIAAWEMRGGCIVNE